MNVAVDEGEQDGSVMKIRNAEPRPFRFSIFRWAFPEKHGNVSPARRWQAASGSMCMWPSLAGALAGCQPRTDYVPAFATGRLAP